MSLVRSVPHPPIDVATLENADNLHNPDKHKKKTHAVDIAFSFHLSGGRIFRKKGHYANIYWLNHSDHQPVYDQLCCTPTKDDGHQEGG